MERTARVTVSLPEALLRALDERITRGGESRSAAIRRLLELELRASGERDEVERYVAGYTERPQTEEEFGWPAAAVSMGKTGNG
jgi:metal-responsive CopG/Arc/MetJ family transcriptional regulator